MLFTGRIDASNSADANMYSTQDGWIMLFSGEKAV